MPIALSWRLVYLRGMGGKATHHTHRQAPTMTYTERRALAAKRLANPALYTRNAEQLSTEQQAAREARSQRVEDNDIIWIG